MMNGAKAVPHRIGIKADPDAVVAAPEASKSEAPRPQVERLKNSFKLPRDLTLSAGIASRSTAGRGRGAQANANSNKKVFTPNLNVTRNKNLEVKTAREPKQTKNNARGERGRGGRGGAGRGRENSLVQTVGVFSEGAGAQVLRRSSSQSRPSLSEVTSQIRRPVYDKKDNNYNQAEENQSLNDLLDESDEDLGTDEDFQMPVILNKPKTEEKSVKYPPSLDEFFSRKEQQMFLIQLPDTLPGRGPEEPTFKNSEKKEEDSKDGIEKQTSPFCTMNTLQEGLIGKFVRLKSGKTKLILGETRFDVELGIDPGFLQEVMSISTNSEERSGNMIELGPVQAKLNVSPDWEFMFNKMT